MIQLGSQGGGSPTLYPVYYLPDQTCVYTIWPFPEGSTSRRLTIVRLQFDYIDLGEGDYLELFSNGLDGQLLLKITGNGASVVGKVITSRSNSVALRFVSDGDSSGRGFRAYYRVIQGSPLDVYLISAIVTVSILSCILCSCCCNNWLSVIVGQSARLNGSGGATRLLSPEEKNRIPTAAYSHPENGKMDMTECCICLGDFELGETVRKLPCSHIFHPACIDTWLEFNTLCPLCKQDVRVNTPETLDTSSNATSGCGPTMRRCICCGMTGHPRLNRIGLSQPASSNATTEEPPVVPATTAANSTPAAVTRDDNGGFEMVELEAGTMEIGGAIQLPSPALLHRNFSPRPGDEEVKEEER